MNEHDLAKKVMTLAGHLQWVKKPTRFYRIKSFEPLEFEPAGWRMHDWITVKLMGVAMKLSGWHWDHWAVEHTDCNPRPCPVCGGQVCEDDTVEQDA